MVGAAVLFLPPASMLGTAVLVPPLAAVALHWGSPMALLIQVPAVGSPELWIMAHEVPAVILPRGLGSSMH